MMRLTVLAFIVAGLIGGGVWLSSMDTSKPLARVEKVIPADALGR